MSLMRARWCTKLKDNYRRTKLAAVCLSGRGEDYCEERAENVRSLALGCHGSGVDEDVPLPLALTSLSNLVGASFWSGSHCLFLALRDRQATAPIPVPPNLLETEATLCPFSAIKEDAPIGPMWIARRGRSELRGAIG
jgi:hypothetical protein